jgi:hypothetical protein
MQGRCAGCEAEGAYKAMLTHVGRCPKFAELFRNDPDRALDPGDEFRRVAAERKPEPVVAEPHVSAPEVSEVPATVPSPKKPPRRRARPAAPAGVVEPERVPGPVVVEHWVVPRGLLDA